MAELMNDGEEPLSDKAKLKAFWCRSIEQYDKDANKWVERSKKIYKRYKDDRGDSKDREGVRYNILWSNVQTLKPALYAKDPSPEVERRFKDEDPVGRVTADVLERCLGFTVSENGFGDIMREVVLDRLLSGRGTSWVRYIPHFRDSEIAGSEDVKDEGAQVTDDAEHDEYEKPQEISYEEIAYDYVYFEDFGYTKSRTWEETRAVWRKVYLAREELVERFGEDTGNKIPLDHKDEGETPDVVLRKATIYEIWDKSTCKALWISKSMPEVLDVRDDPLGLDSFFPCPKPLFATIANDSTIPVPDYALYQDQAIEIDTLTQRIAMITKAIKVAGVYDTSAAGISRLLNEGVENQLIPVDNWAAFAEKGGLAGAMSMLPVAEIAQVLQTLYEIRDKVKQDLYEISGMSDIIRGASNPNETATAQQIKSNYASVRLNDMQKDVQRFARDLLRIAGQVISNHFQIDTIKKICGIKLMTEQEKQEFQQKQQMVMMQAQQTGQPPQQPPKQLVEMMKEPSWEQVDELLKDSESRAFRIDIETDSTIMQDAKEEQASRLEFVNTIGQVIGNAVGLTKEAPALLPAIAESIMFLVRGYKVGRPTEAAFQEAMDKITELASQPPKPEQEQQDNSVQVEQMKQQGNAQNTQIKAQSDAQLLQQKHQNDLQVEQMKAQSAAELEQQKASYEAQIQSIKTESDAALEKYKIDLQAHQETMKLVNESAHREADRNAQALQASAGGEE